VVVILTLFHEFVSDQLYFSIDFDRLYIILILIISVILIDYCSR